MIVQPSEEATATALICGSEIGLEVDVPSKSLLAGN